MEKQTIIFFAVVCTASFIVGRYLQIRSLFKPNIQPVEKEPVVRKVLELDRDITDKFAKISERNKDLKMHSDKIEIDTRRAWLEVRKRYHLELENHLSVSSDFNKLYIMDYGK